MVRNLLFFLLLFFFFFNYALVCKKSATELHEEGNIVYIEYFMRLVHNSDEKKKSLEFLKSCCYYPVLPWMKISVLSSQHILQVFRSINMFLSCIYTYVYFWKVLPFSFEGTLGVR